MKKIYILLAFSGLAMSLVFAFYTFNKFIYNQKQAPNPSTAPAPYEATLTGTYVCLPHRDTSGPQTMECAFGLKTASGEHYALDFGENSTGEEFRAGETATLFGTITPIEYLSSDHWQIYDIVGILSIKANADDKSDLIKVQTPLSNQRITSPFEVRGRARGTWFFEASFPIVLVDWDGKIIAQGHADAVLDPNDPNSTWMTEDFVAFKATLEFENPSFEADFSKRGSLILQKNNPSGLPQNDDALEIPVRFD